MSVLQSQDAVSDLKIGQQVIVIVKNDQKNGKDYLAGQIVDLTPTFVYLHIPGLYKIRHLKRHEILELQIKKEDCLPCEARRV